MSGADTAHAWLERAESDLLYAQVGNREVGRYSVTCYLCQQVAEKTLKGLLCAKNLPLERIHHLGRLATLTAPHYRGLQTLIPQLRTLDKYYITARYPDDLTAEFTAKDATAALKIAEAILQFAFKHIPT